MEMHGGAREYCTEKLFVTSLIKQFTRIALRLLCLSLGAWLTAVIPVAIMVTNLPAANAAAGYPPNMDPGVMIVFAEMFTAPVIVVVVAIELLRCWAFERKPLTLVAYAALGALAASPIGLTLTRHVPDLAPVRLGLFATVAIVAGYALWRAWRASR